MKRLVFPLIIAALSICQNANAQNANRIYMARFPSTLASAESTQAVTTAESVKSSASVGGGYYDGMNGGGFSGGGCGCQNTCCDGVWNGYHQGCGIFGHHGRHHGGCCNPCGGCGGGGCFGNSFAGGCGGCGGCGHHGGWFHSFAHHCKGLFHHGHGMFFSCDSGCGSASSSGCGCAGGGNMMTNGYHGNGNADGNSNGNSGLNAPPAPPAETVPPAPTAAQASEKSAQRNYYSRPFGTW
jgi:hypothetical protein